MSDQDKTAEAVERARKAGPLELPFAVEADLAFQQLAAGEMPPEDQINAAVWIARLYQALSTAQQSEARAREALGLAFYNEVGRALALRVQRNDWQWPEDAPDHVSGLAETLRSALASLTTPKPEEGEMAKRIMDGLSDALAHARGEPTGAVVHHVQVASPAPSSVEPVGWVVVHPDGRLWDPCVFTETVAGIIVKHSPESVGLKARPAFTTPPDAQDRVEALEEALRDTLAHLIAAISLLERSPKTAAPSDKMFDQMLKDYRASAKRARAALKAEEKG